MAPASNAASKFIAVGNTQRILNKADTLKVESNRTGFAHHAAALAEDGADIADRTVLLSVIASTITATLPGPKPS